MKKLVSSLALGLLVCSQPAAFAQNVLESDPGYLGIDKIIDLKTIRPEVNVNLPQFLLKDAASGLTGGANDPFAGTGINFADLIKDIKLIRVLVIDVGEEHQDALEKSIKALRAELESKWTAVVTVPEESVGVYVRSNATGETMAGLAVLVHDGSDAVIANVVGNVSIGKIIQIASRMDKFPKNLLKQLSMSNSGSEDKPEPAAEKAEPASK